MSNSNKKSSPDDKKVAEGAATTNSQSDNKQSDKDKSPPKADTQPDKVAEGAAAYNQSGNKQSDNDISQPDDEMERYATKGDVKALSNKMDEKFAAMDEKFAAMDEKFATKKDMALYQSELKAYIAIQIKDSIKFLTNVIFYVFGFGVGVAGLILAFIAFFFGTK